MATAFESDDIWLVAFLSCAGLAPGSRRYDGRRVWFVFERTVALESAVNGYDLNAAVPAKAFARAVSRVRRMVDDFAPLRKRGSGGGAHNQRREVSGAGRQGRDTGRQLLEERLASAAQRW